MRPANEATPAPAPEVTPAPAPPAAEVPHLAVPKAPLAQPRTPPAKYATVACPDGRFAVGGWVAGLNQPSLVLQEPLKVPMRSDFCTPQPDDQCTLAPQTFTPGGYTGMEDLVTVVHVPKGRVKIHWVGEGGCLLWQDGQSVLDIDNCPDNPPELEWEPDISLLPATCTDGRKGWFSEPDLLEAGALQGE